VNRYLIAQQAPGRSVIYERLSALRDVSPSQGRDYVERMAQFVGERLEHFLHFEATPDEDYEEGLRNVLMALNSWFKGLQELLEAPDFGQSLAETLERAESWEERLHRGSELLAKAAG
jgi:hypothetical protein